MPRSFALGEHFEKLIDDQVKSGLYNNASEVVRNALRLLEDYSIDRQWSVKELRRLVAEADEDEGTVDGEEVFKRLIKKHKAMARR
jgi:antitoxin ParD1/3/4